MNCNLIKQDINQICDPVTNMTEESDGLIINFTEINTKVLDTTNKTICKELTLKPGTGIIAQKITIFGMKPFAGKVTGANVNYGTSFGEELPIALYGDTPATASIVNSMTKGARFLILVKQAAQRGTSAYRILYGFESGLYADASTLEPYGEEGGWMVTLKSEKNSGSRYFLWNTDEETTKAIEDALLVAATA